MDRRVALGVLLWFFAFKAVAASTWNAGSASSIIRIGQASDCSITWYSPGVFVHANGDLGFVAQGNNPASGIASDSLFTARRSTSSGVWTVPLNTDAPALTGLYMIGGSPQNCGYSQTNPGPLSAAKPIYLPESISGVPGGRYYMAFGGGNADGIRGQVYWAYSDDAVHWVVWKFAPLPAGFQWRPLVGPLYGDPGFSPDPTCYPYGIGQVMLNYDPDTSLGPQGGFYLHLTYYHLPSEPRTLDMIAYRFQYDTSANGFGLGGNPRSTPATRLPISAAGSATRGSWCGPMMERAPPRVIRSSLPTRAQGLPLEPDRLSSCQTGSGCGLEPSTMRSTPRLPQALPPRTGARPQK